MGGGRSLSGSGSGSGPSPSQRGSWASSGRKTTFGARPRVFPGWQTAPGGGQVAVWPCAGAVEAGVPSLRLLSVEAPGARAQRGSWASCAPQPLAKGVPRLADGARWGSGGGLALCGRGGGRSALTSAFVGGGARRPGPERQLGVLRPPAFGLWPEARPRVFPGWQTAPGWCGGRGGARGGVRPGTWAVSVGSRPPPPPWHASGPLL